MIENIETHDCEVICIDKFETVYFLRARILYTRVYRHSMTLNCYKPSPIRLGEYQNYFAWDSVLRKFMTNNIKMKKEIRNRPTHEFTHFYRSYVPLPPKIILTL